MSTSRRTRVSRITEAELNDLLLKLQALLPEYSNSRSTRRVAAPEVLNETCNYIKRLHREVDGLSERLSQLLGSMEGNGVDVDILRSLLQR
ncbi:hypothetical protein LguiA_009579 [Lonicera macranthoides]